MLVPYLRSLSLLTLSCLFLPLPPLQSVSRAEPTNRLNLPRVQRQPQPKPIVRIDRKTAKQTTLLSEAEIDTIRTLQSASLLHPYSQVSPDETTIVVSLTNPTESEPTYHFLNILDGSHREIESQQFQGFSPFRFSWDTSDTVVTLGWKFTDRDKLEYALLKANRHTGKVTIQPLSLPGEPLSLASDNSRVLVKFTPPSQGPQKEDAESNDPSLDRKPTEFMVVGLPDGKEQYRFALPAETLPLDISWSPDGTKLALIRGWGIDGLEDDSDGENLASPITRDSMGALPPVDNPYLQKNGLQLFDLKTRQQQLIYASDSDGATFSTVKWSPDGETLLVRLLQPVSLKGRPYPIYSWQHQGTFRFYDNQLRAIGGLNRPELSNADPDFENGLDQIGGQFMSPDEIIFTALQGMNVHLYLYNYRSGELRRLSLQDGSYGDVVVLPRSRQVVFSYSSFTQPQELYRMQVNSSEMSPITTHNEAVASQSKTRADRVTFTLANGEILDGILLQPADADFPPNNVPLVVWQHGGPVGDMTNVWSADVELPFALLPNAGIPLLIVPLYGRNGFGTERFTRLYNDQNFGKIDIDAMAEILQQAIARGYTSAGKIGITGCSYGGYFTFQSIIQYPTLYAAANPQCALVDNTVEWKTRGRGGVAPFAYGGPTPYTSDDRFRRDSPIYNTNRIKTPLLIFHGSQDFLPATLVENLYWMTAVNGVPVRMVKFLGAGHGLVNESGNSIPEYQLYAAQEMIQWFRTYLQIPAAEPEPEPSAQAKPSN